MIALPYDREIMVAVLVAHQRRDSSGCLCGWGVLGASHPEHIADEYERAATEAPPGRSIQCRSCGYIEASS